MPADVILSVTAVLAMVPAALAARWDTRPSLYWLLLAVAFAGPAVWILWVFSPGWRTGLAAALWVTIAANLLVFGAASAVWREARRLSPLLLPYLILLGVVAGLLLHQPEHNRLSDAAEGWTLVHIVTSVLAYALLTVGAVAGFAVFLQERALKNKRPGKLTHALPAVADGERLQVSLLVLSAIALGFGLVSGVAARYELDRRWFALDHKTVLSVATFIVLLALLTAHRTSGLRGRRASRFVLLAYLLLTLAYPGVKFVTDVILA